MKSILIKTVQKHYPVFAIFFLEIILFFANYEPQAFLIGWDNLVPELNFALNIKRDFSAIWQEYRGLGLLDGMAHAANLPHDIFRYLLSFFFPLNAIRYFFIFLMHFLGGLGMYKLISLNLKGYDGKLNNKLSPLFGALFYQYNLITIQIFYAPLELFVIHFAFLPWLIYYVMLFLRGGSKKHLIRFFILSILAIPQAHVPSIFLVYIFAVIVLLIWNMFKKGKQGVKRSIILICVIFVVNSFWGLPYVYSAVKNAGIITNSKINLMSTDDLFLRNKAFGDFQNTALMKGFSLDYSDLQPNGQFDLMMWQWRENLKKPLVNFIGWIFFGLAILGIERVISLRKKELYPFIFLFIFSFLVLGNNIPILGIFSFLLTRFIPFFYDIFRITFTKFSILYAFSFTVLVIFALQQLSVKIRYKSVVIVIVIFLLFFQAMPAFLGHFIYYNLRIKIPQSYFSTIDFLKRQNNNTRIMLLPELNFWGWHFYRWGARGSGFLWHGLPQSTMDRSFDPWGNRNENYYWELSYALAREDMRLFNNILEKYQLSFVLFDDNIIFPDNLSYKGSVVAQRSFIKNNPKLKLAAQFNNISIYQVNLKTTPESFVYLTQDLPVVGPEYQWNNYDRAYSEYGQYVSQPQNSELKVKSSIFYPFRSLFSGRGSKDLEFAIYDSGKEFIFKTALDQEMVGGTLIFPAVDKEEISERDKEDVGERTFDLPKAFLDQELIPLSNKEIKLSYIKEGNFEVRVPKLTGYYSYDSYSPENELFLGEQIQCVTNPVKPQLLSTQKILTEGTEKFIHFNSIDAHNCRDLYLPNLKNANAYIIGVKSRNLKGRPFHFWLENLTAKRADMQLYLTEDRNWHWEYFVVPPMAQDAIGYSLHFDSVSIGKEETVNDLARVTINPIPYKFLTGIRIVKRDGVIKLDQKIINQKDYLTINHPNPSLYEVEIKPGADWGNETTLILSQAYDQGWKIYQVKNGKLKLKNFLNRYLPFVFGKRIGEHVLVNNWANGWQDVPQESITVIIVYLPQYLQYLGFVCLLLVPIAFFLRYNLKRGKF